MGTVWFFGPALQYTKRYMKAEKTVILGAECTAKSIFSVKKHKNVLLPGENDP